MTNSIRHTVFWPRIPWRKDAYSFMNLKPKITTLKTNHLWRARGSSPNENSVNRKKCTIIKLWWRNTKLLTNCSILCYCAQLLSSVRHDCQAPLQTVACQAPLPMEFSRQDYWSGLPFPTSGDLSKPGIEPRSFEFPKLPSGFFTTSATWEAHVQSVADYNLANIWSYLLLGKLFFPFHWY